MIPVKSTMASKNNAPKFGINKSATPKSADKFAQKPVQKVAASPDSSGEESKVKVIDDDEEEAKPVAVNK